MFKNILIIATLFLLKIDQVNAQDSVAARNFFQQDSLLKNELLQAKKLLYHTLQQNALVIEINQQVSYAFYNYGYLQNVYLSANGLQFMCNSSQTATIFFNGITDLKFKINTIENSIQSGGLVTEHKLSIGNTTLSVKQNNYNILKAIQQQFIQLQNLLNIDHFGMIAFKQKAIEFKGMSNKTATIEEIRKCIVQAEVQAKLYNYEKAIEDFTKDKHKWKLRVQGKGKSVKSEIVDVPPQTAEAIHNYVESRGELQPHQPLFASNSNRTKHKNMSVRGIREAISIRLEASNVKQGRDLRLTPFSLRHTAGILMAESGFSVEQVMERMRIEWRPTALLYFKQAGLLHSETKPDSKEYVGESDTVENL